MVLNILLLAILFIAGLFNLFFYFNTKKFRAWFQSFFQSSVVDSKPSPKKIDEASMSKDDKVGSSRKPELRRVFATFDKDSDGFITKQELRDSLKNIRIFLSEREVEEMVGKLDVNGDGLIDFEEFGALCESMVGREHERVVMRNGDDDEEDLKEAFEVFDKDKDGLISFDELGSILSSLGLKEGKRVESCKEMIKKVDMDGDGMVNFQEFKKMMKSGALNISN